MPPQISRIDAEEIARRLVEYKGPKLATRLRRQFREQVHVLFERAQLLTILDPRFEEELKRFKLDESMKLFAKALEERVAEHASRQEPTQD